MESLQQTVLLQVAGAKIKVGILLDFEVVLWKKKKKAHIKPLSAALLLLIQIFIL